MAKARRNRAASSSAEPGFSNLSVALAAIAISFAVYAPALQSPFFSDDLHYVESNAYVHTISVENAVAIWSPQSPVVGIVENYAPVHLTLHSLAWQAFGSRVLGHHVLNVLLHAAVGFMWVLFFRRLGIAPRIALWLGAVFLVHPANIEAVAWISQLKTTSSMALMLGALALQPRRPLVALICFGLALFAKPTAAVAFPVAVLLQIQQTRAANPVAGFADWFSAPGSRWWAGWAAVLGVFAVVEFAAFFDTAGSAPPLYAALDVRLRTLAAVALRYLATAMSGSGLAVFHDPPAARSWLDPWFLGGVLWMALVAWRGVHSWKTRSLEIVCWCLVVVSFAPISGVIPLPHAMADRYLYFMLPGLLGAAGLIATRRLPEPLPQPVAVGALAFVLLLGVGANRHATLWQSAEKLLAHSEARYPDGKVAVLRSARRAALAGDVDKTVAALRLVMVRGFDRLDTLVSDPAYRALRGRPKFDAIIDELAAKLIERGAPGPNASQAGLRVRGQAQFVIGEYAGARRSLEQAIEVGGPYTEAVAAELDQLRQLERQRGLF
jgi:hypothetical protein